jgi:preprotein translocase subunit SecF
MDASKPISFMRLKWLYFAISLLVLIPGAISLIRFGLRLSIDFTGGSLLEIQTPSSIDQTKLYDVAKSQKLELSAVQTSNNNTYLLRFKPITQNENTAYTAALGKSLNLKVTTASFQSVGPTVGAELTRNALLAVTIASLCIIIYIAWSFRKIPHPYSSWKFGVSAVIALLHDALVLLGVFSIFGVLYHVEVDTLFVTALLTVIGFSVHDTIVVFDRIRENLPKLPKASFSQVVDFSLTETLNRSLNTSLTVILTLTALLLFGGDSVRWFVVALLVGITSGTYSSIFNAAPILVLWEQKNSKSN